MGLDIEGLVVRHALRVPVPDGQADCRAGAGGRAARQLDVALMSLGFKLSRELLAALCDLTETAVAGLGSRLLAVVRAMVGDHVQHNVYFRDFPENVPDTVDFWARSLLAALLDPEAAAALLGDLEHGRFDLLKLPDYGRYLHSFEDMLAAHDQLIPSAGDRVTVLHKGGPVHEEAARLYLSLAGASAPLGESGQDALRQLAEHCADGEQPGAIPVREHRAIVNAVRARRMIDLGGGAEPLLDTTTDVLRLACELSGGDVSLAEAKPFRGLSRPLRRMLLAGLDRIVRDNRAKLGDVNAHREQWKRLGERLHPHEHPHFPFAAEVFAVARGEQRAPSFAARVEHALGDGDFAGAAALLRPAPGLLFRSLDRLLRGGEDPGANRAVLDAARRASDEVSGRVLLSLREHLENRASQRGSRVFVNRFGRGVVTQDHRAPIPAGALAEARELLDEAVRRRLPAIGSLVVDPAVFDVALPLSGKAASGGFAILPRGSVSPVEGDLLRFFVYWRERATRTDYDLSALLFDRGFTNPRWLSYTNLAALGGAHSGDITSAPDGASEFVDVDLAAIRADFVIPQVNIYTGEGFAEVAESFFGHMLRDRDQAGQPFEPRTVRAKSELRDAGRVALPLVFRRGEDGLWSALWLHLCLAGAPHANQVEGNRATTGDLVRGMVERTYLRMGYLVDLLASNGTHVTRLEGRAPTEPVVYLGVARPEGLPAGSTAYTLENLAELIPA